MQARGEVAKGAKGSEGERRGAKGVKGSEGERSGFYTRF